MITVHHKQNGERTYKVRVFLKGRLNPLLRVTRQRGGLKNQQEAEREEARLRKECERELHALEARGVLWCDLVDGWYEHQLRLKVHTGKRSQLNHDDYLGSLKKWFGEYLRRPAAELNGYVLVEVFEAMKAQGLSLGHRKKLKQVVKSVFDYGIGSGLLPLVHRSPTMDVVLKRGEEKKPEILTLEEIQRLIQKAVEDDHSWQRIWTTALLTGMRSGELFALTWADVDFENRILSVTKSYNCRMRETKSTKAGTWRQVPVSQKLVEILSQQKAETGKASHVFPRHWEWERGLQAKVLRRFCFIHGLPSIKFHTLRACFATQMLRQGVEAAKVMKICGWKELKTMQHYVRLAGIEVQGATERLEFFGGVGRGIEPTLASPDVTGAGHT
jgi:integrase